jgi:hypothetical protein
VLITNNESEFGRVSHLKIENWAIWIYIDLYYSHRIVEQPFFQVICLFLHLFPFNVRCSSFLRAAFLQDDTLASSSFSPFKIRCWTFDVQCSFFLIPPDTCLPRRLVPSKSRFSVTKSEAQQSAGGTPELYWGRAKLGDWKYNVTGQPVGDGK